MTGTAALRALMRNAIDYAGLFPPAALSMSDAVQQYAAYRVDADAWALGRFVVPIVRLDEMVEARGRSHTSMDADERWSLSALLGADTRDDLARLAAFNLRETFASGNACIDAVELRADSEESIREMMWLLPPTIETFIEIPLGEDTDALVAAIARTSAMAKVRTGGVTASAFPAPESLLRFLRACAREGVAFKATAGLHHPLYATHRLTYQADSESAPMFGYLNVFLATAFIRDGIDDESALALLVESDPFSIRFADDAVVWRDRRVAREALETVRRRSLRGFGSCSFREPIDELAALHLDR